MLFRFRAPLAPDSRVQDLFERAFFCRVLEDYGAKFLSIQAARSGKDLIAKLLSNFLFNAGLKIDKLMRGPVGIKKLRGRQQFAQALGESRFTRGKAAGDPNGGHLL